MNDIVLVTICGLVLVSVATLVAIRLWYRMIPVPEVIKNPKLLHILIKDTSEYSLEHAKELFAELHTILTENNTLASLEIIAGSYGLHFIITSEAEHSASIREIFARFYPDADLDEVGDYTSSIHTTHKLMSVAQFGLTHKFALPLRHFQDFSHDPLAGLYKVLQNTTMPNEVWLQLVLRPAPQTWKSAARRMTGGDNLTRERRARIETKLAQPGFQFVIRGLVKSDNFNTAGVMFGDIARSFAVYESPQLNKISQSKKHKDTVADLLRYLLVGKTRSESLDDVTKYEQRLLDHLSEDVIVPSELAGLWHVPDLDDPVELASSNAELMLAPEHSLAEI